MMQEVLFKCMFGFCYIVFDSSIDKIHMSVKVYISVIFSIFINMASALIWLLVCAFSRAPYVKSLISKVSC